MFVPIRGSISLKEIIRLFHKTNFQTTSFKNTKSVSGISYSLFEMPVITAVVVAAHRNTVHTSCRRIQTLEKQISMLDIRPYGYETDPMNFLRRSNSLSNPAMSGRNLFDDSIGNSRKGMPHEIRRFYAKGKDKSKTKKSVVSINESEMSEIINVESFKTQLLKLLEQMKDEFSKQLNVRGASGALETLTVEFEGETYPLQELAQVGRKNPQLAVLNLSSLPEACQPVIKAIQDSGMNLNPQQEGTTIYVPLPKVTREHRENLSKNAKTLFNKYKLSFHAVQNKYIKQCKSQKEGISEDLAFNVQQQIIKLTDAYVDEAEKLMQSKQKELLENK